MIHKLFRYIRDGTYRFKVNAAHGLYRSMSDEAFLKKAFKAHFGYELDLDNPRTFNEKLQWLKLYDRKPIYTTMVDKYAVKDYVASIIGEEYIIPTLGVWDNFDEIDFDSLPDQFVLKCTHDSGGLVICTDKTRLDLDSARKKMTACLKRNYYYKYREWPYKNVKPRIIAEKYMQDSATGELRDYKFFCFGGVAKCYKVDFDRFIAHHANYFTMDGKLMKLGEEAYPPDFERDIQPPTNLEQMKKLADKLSESVPFLRADFYDVDGKTYFGELTFFPRAGFGKFIYDGNDKLFENWIKLPNGGYILVKERLAVHLQQGKPIVVKKGSVLNDYKVYTMNGKAKVCMINQDRGTHTRADYFDKEYNWLDFTWGYDHADKKPEKPQSYDLMFELAEKLAVDTLELRVDFYEVNGKVYLGELTFFDGAGFDKIDPKELDYKLGSMLSLPIS